MPRRTVSSLQGRWSMNLHNIGKKIEIYQGKIKRGDKRVDIFNRKIVNLARNANSLAIKLINFESVNQ
ncbi:MAG: hypothetical protein Q8O59_04375 [bacterium]|nr:hypothetical protein [bacterium]